MAYRVYRFHRLVRFYTGLFLGQTDISAFGYSAVGVKKSFQLTVNGAEYPVFKGETLLSAFIRCGISFDTAYCGGSHTCGKCLVRAEGRISPPEEKELFLLGSKADEGFRLACFCKAEGAVTVFFEESSVKTELPDAENTIKKPVSTICSVFDIGTTTVAALYYDADTKALIYSEGQLNVQSVFGADVMSRIGHAFSRENGDAELAEATASQLKKINASFSEHTGIPLSAVKKTVITGNTAMELIAAGLSVRSLAAAPFEPMSRLGFRADGSRFGTPEADIYFMKCAGGFFGGDIIASSLYAESLNKNSEALFVTDIGTNGEMALLDSGGIYGCSTAAGPAFEGVGITCGSPSFGGAICKAVYKGSCFVTETIGNRPPASICGSGLLDVAAEALSAGLIDENGALVNGGRLDITDKIYITRGDLAAFRQAKSAVCAGALVLLRKLKGKSFTTAVAGGFGSSLNIKNAVKTGLLPVECGEKVITLGNGAALGASLLLFDESMIKKAEALADRTEITDLVSDRFFADKYFDGLYIGPVSLKGAPLDEEI